MNIHPSEKKVRKRDQFIRERNIQSKHVCFIIAVLNLLGHIKLKRPFKLRTHSLPFIQVISVTINNKTYDLSQMTHERINERIQEDMRNRVPPGTIVRRQEQYRIVEHMHALFDVLKQTRFTFDTTIEKRDYNAEREMLKSVTVDGLVYEEEMIQSVGMKIHDILTAALSSAALEEVKQIPHGDTELMSLLLEPFS